MPETHFDDWIAERYETLWPELFDRAVVDPTVNFLAQLAGAGPVSIIRSTRLARGPLSGCSSSVPLSARPRPR
jgi:hypothetical protein